MWGETLVLTFDSDVRFRRSIPMFESVEAIEVMSDEKQKRLSFVTAGEKGIVRNWTLSRASKAEKYSCKQDSSEETTSSSQKPYIALLRKDNDELVAVKFDSDQIIRNMKLEDLCKVQAALDQH